MPPRCVEGLDGAARRVALSPRYDAASLDWLLGAGARQAPPRRAAGPPASRARRRDRRLVPLLPERHHEQGAADPRARRRRARGARPSVPARLAARRRRDRRAHGAAARAHARPAALPVPQHQRLRADPFARRGAARRAGARRRVLQPAGGRMVDALRRRAARRGDRHRRPTASSVSPLRPAGFPDAQGRPRPRRRSRDRAHRAVAARAGAGRVPPPRRGGGPLRRHRQLGGRGALRARLRQGQGAGPVHARARLLGRCADASAACSPTASASKRSSRTSRPRSRAWAATRARTRRSAASFREYGEGWKCKIMLPSILEATGSTSRGSRCRARRARSATVRLHARRPTCRSSPPRTSSSACAR